MWLTSCEKNPEYVIINGHEFVDLGLPSGLKWATCNVGANNPEEYGNYYAWGETSTKSSYDVSNCVTYEQQIGDISGDSRYDVANRNWGRSCRIPTSTEFEELIDKCIWQWFTQNGVNGYRVTGPSGNSIFIPAGGYCNGTQRYEVDMSCFYWTSTPHLVDDYHYYFAKAFLYTESPFVTWVGRTHGLTIRPVSD